jgi:nucleotidyltransferase substrate binding protein (TIGR01987 family)
MEALDVSALERAVARLTEGLARYALDTSDDQIRDGLIQRFEFTYELSHRTLKRYLVTMAGAPEPFDTMTFPDLIRSGNDAGLLRSEWAAWKRFREVRAKSSHTYDPGVAMEVVAEIPDFLTEAQYLLAALQQRLA